MSIAIIMSAGVGLAGVLSGFVKDSAAFNSFLFGSIVAITDFELYMVIGISILVIIAFILLYKGKIKMMNNIKKYLKIFILWLTGGFSYFFLEILFRGRSHWTMFLLGGFCFLLIGALNEYLNLSLF